MMATESAVPGLGLYPTVLGTKYITRADTNMAESRKSAIPTSPETV